MPGIDIKQIINEAKKTGQKLFIVIKNVGQSPQIGSTERPAELGAQLGEVMAGMVNILFSENGRFTRDEILSAVEATAHAHAVKLLKTRDQSFDIHG